MSPSNTILTKFLMKNLSNKYNQIVVDKEKLMNVEERPHNITSILNNFKKNPLKNLTRKMAKVSISNQI